MPSPDDRWLDDDAGPLVRPYALTRGRTRPSGEGFDLVAPILAARDAEARTQGLEPEHIAVLRRCRVPTCSADLASDLDLPLGVIRILLADLRERGLVQIHRSVSAPMNDRRILREVVDGLRKLLSREPASQSAGEY